MSSEFDDEKMFHCKRCGEHWPVDDYEFEYNKNLGICSECGSQYMEEVEECKSGEGSCSLMYPEAIAVNDYLVKDSGEVQWNRRLFKDLGIPSDDNGVLLAVGFNAKEKDAATGLYIIGEDDGASVAGLLKVAIGKGSSPRPSWFTEDYGLRAGKSKYYEILAKFKKWNKKEGLDTIEANNVAEMLEQFGRDESVKGHKISGDSHLTLLTKEVEELKKQILDFKGKA